MLADIAPFKGIHFNYELNLKDIICPPYDVVDKNDIKMYLSRSPYNMIRLDVPNSYDSVSDTLLDWQKNGVLVRDDEDSLYVYREDYMFNGMLKSIIGVICRVKLEALSSNVILSHEETIGQAKNDRLKLMKSTFCNFSSIYSIYKDEDKSIYELISKVLESDRIEIDINDYEGNRHRLWRISDKDMINNLVSKFANKKLYIADGHHRYETALGFKDWCNNNGIMAKGSKYTMMTLVDVDSSDITILPTHRLLSGLEYFNVNSLIESCKKYFDIYKVEDYQSIISCMSKGNMPAKTILGLYAGSKDCYILEFSDYEKINTLLFNKSKVFKELDVTVLQTLILQDILGLEFTDGENINVSYTRDTTKIIDSVNSGESQLAFLLNPVNISDIYKITDLGDKMPPKTTYFYPKLTTGLIINRID